jgi:hypothetical protein
MWNSRKPKRRPTYEISAATAAAGRAAKRAVIGAAAGDFEREHPVAAREDAVRHQRIRARVEQVPRRRADLGQVLDELDRIDLRRPVAPPDEVRDRREIGRRGAELGQQRGQGALPFALHEAVELGNFVQRGCGQERRVRAAGHDRRVRQRVADGPRVRPHRVVAGREKRKADDVRPLPFQPLGEGRDVQPLFDRIEVERFVAGVPQPRRQEAQSHVRNDRVVALALVVGNSQQHAHGVSDRRPRRRSFSRGARRWPGI